MMRTFARAGIAVWLLFLAGCGTVEERAADRMVYHFPRRQALPGEVVPFALRLPREISGSRIYFNQKQYRLFPRPGDSESNAITYFPVPPDLPAGKYPIDCSFDVVQGKQALRQHFYLRVGTVKEAGEPKKVSFKNFKWEAFRAEQQRIQNLLAESRYPTDRLMDFKLPLSGEVIATYGSRKLVNGKHLLEVRGLEIVASKLSSQEVAAIADGQVVLAKPLPQLGYTVVIDHGFSHASLYSHLGQSRLQEGQQVRRGQVIGKPAGSGATAQGRELWFQLYVAGVPVDPQKIMKIEIY